MLIYQFSEGWMVEENERGVEEKYEDVGRWW